MVNYKIFAASRARLLLTDSSFSRVNCQHNGESLNFSKEKVANLTGLSEKEIEKLK